MQPLGQLLLVVTFFVTLGTALTAAGGALLKNPTWMRAARQGVFATAALSVAMAIILTHGLLSHDFSNKYIATYSDRDMPTLYLLASFWGGEKGALLFWTTSLSIFSSIAIGPKRDRDPTYMAWTIAILMGAVFFFDLLMVFESSPFESFMTTRGPADGKGLNPLLQNPTMVFHPPSLLTGYISFTLPFAFAMGALLSGRLDDQWIHDCRRWTLVSFVFLSVGLVLGMLWAYEEIGWGFWWMWDPVENAGFIPWCPALAFLHSVMIQERRGMFKRWNVILVCLTFFLTILGTFLTRSQLIDSIHAFADSTLAEYFLVYLGVLLVGSVMIIAWRWRALRSEASIENFLSRESFFVLNNVILVMASFIVLFGTLYPKLSESEGFREALNALAAVWNATLGLVFGPASPLDDPQNLAEDWFNNIFAFIGLALLFLVGTGILIAWRRASVSQLRRNFLTPIAGSFVGTSVVSAISVVLALRGVADEHQVGFGQALDNWVAGLGPKDIGIFLCYWLAAFAAWTHLREFHRGAVAGRQKRAQSYVSSLVGLVARNPRRYGGYVVHLGFLLMVIGFTGKFWKDQLPERLLAQGERMEIDDYHLTFVFPSQSYHADEGFAANRATVAVLHQGETVAEREVADLAQWLKEREVGVVRISTELHSPKMTVHFADPAARDRLREDYYLATTFRSDFKEVLVRPEARSLTYRLRDEALVGVVPMLAMQKIRAAKLALHPGSTLEAEVVTEMGSPELTLRFRSDQVYAAFQERLAAANVPETLLACLYDAETGALQLIDARTGVLRYPEVRYYAKHQTPTTEASITSSMLEDLYLAIQPRMEMGGAMASLAQPFINLLAVVFPLVGVLWMGAILLVLGVLVCLTPPWLSRTFLHLVRGARPGASAVALLLALALPLGAQADELLPAPPLAVAPAGHPGVDFLGRFRCGCPSGEVRKGGAVVTLADPDCACPEAEVDRQVAREAFARQDLGDRRSGLAKIKAMELLTGVNPQWDTRLLYDPARYHDLQASTKTTCPGERGLLLSQSQLGCSVRGLWLPRFRRMLAAGWDQESIFRYYVDANNLDFAPDRWAYDDLRADPDPGPAWVAPVLLVVAGAVGFVYVSIRVGRRRRTTESREAQGRQSPELSEPEKQDLTDALETHLAE
jgi:cytochrome c-type biogenesis protein CcmF